jgi:hypothetical protein
MTRTARTTNVPAAQHAAWLASCGVPARTHHARPAWQVRGIGPRAVRLEAAGLARMAAFRSGRTPLARQRRALAFVQAGADVRTGARTFRARIGNATYVW